MIAVEDNSENTIMFSFQSKLSAEAMKELCVIDQYRIKSLFLPSVFAGWEQVETVSLYS